MEYNSASISGIIVIGMKNNSGKAFKQERLKSKGDIL